MTITCTVTPAAEATGVKLHITQGSSGDWKWGDFAHALPDIVTPVLYMQNFTTSQCASMAQGEQIQLADSRDNKTYWVGKLTDGNCWMTQNLDLDLSTSTTLTPTNTNISSNWTPRASTTTTISGYDSETGKSYNPGDQHYEGTGSEHYHVGNYYQWSAATAGYTGTSQSTKSICPKGWTLPSQSQFQQLINSGLSGPNFMSAPYYLLRGGRLGISSLYGAGSYGYYWSSTPSGSGHAYTLYFLSGGVLANNGEARYRGLPVRCVAAG